MARVAFSFAVALIVVCYVASYVGEFFAGVVNTLP